MAAKGVRKKHEVRTWDGSGTKHVANMEYMWKGETAVLAYTYKAKGTFKLEEKPVPEILSSTDAIVRVTLSSICTSDLHIKHGSAAGGTRHHRGA